jgi:hypothetical protein
VIRRTDGSSPDLQKNRPPDGIDNGPYVSSAIVLDKPAVLRKADLAGAVLNGANFPGDNLRRAG